MTHADGADRFTLTDLGTLVTSLHADWHMFSICDLVYNHMANDAEFVQRVPDATYNMGNSPHLRPAFVLDRIIHHLSLGIALGRYEAQGVRADRLDEHNLETLRHIMRSQEIPKHKMVEFYTMDVGAALDRIRARGLARLDAIAADLDRAREAQRASDVSSRAQ